MKRLLVIMLAASILFNVVLLLRRSEPGGGTSMETSSPPLSESEPALPAEPTPEPSGGQLALPKDATETKLREELPLLRNRVEQLQVRLQEALEHGPTADSLPPDMVARLDTPIKVELQECSVSEVLEFLRGQCGLHFVYDPVLQPRIETIRMSMSIDKLSPRKLLHYIDMLSEELEVQYMNQFVWIRSREKPK